MFEAVEFMGDEFARIETSGLHQAQKTLGALASAGTQTVDQFFMSQQTAAGIFIRKFEMDDAGIYGEDGDCAAVFGDRPGRFKGLLVAAG